jgi:phosphatidylinositol kinase/protein kinase (PI-3  family)
MLPDNDQDCQADRVSVRLGDRHGENILVDTTNGDVVHVDFNCLFGMVRLSRSLLPAVANALLKGLVWFDIVEKVPFRLTQNVIDGFGITGVEGVFRNVCEITMRILRQNKTSLINVLESFVHDPLLDLQLSRPGAVSRSSDRPFAFRLMHGNSARAPSQVDPKRKSRKPLENKRCDKRKRERRSLPSATS